MTDQQWVRVAHTGDLHEGRGTRVSAGGQEIVLWRVNGEFSAVADHCSHQHVPVIHEAALEGKMVTCPMHGWTYALASGAEVPGRGRLRTYSVRVDGEDVYVLVPAGPQRGERGEREHPRFRSL